MKSSALYLKCTLYFRTFVGIRLSFRWQEHASRNLRKFFIIIQLEYPSYWIAKYKRIAPLSRERTLSWSVKCICSHWHKSWHGLSDIYALRMCENRRICRFLCWAIRKDGDPRRGKITYSFNTLKLNTDKMFIGVSSCREITKYETPWNTEIQKSR